jgi:hypothetical protein
MKLNIVCLIIIVQSLLFCVAPLHPILWWGSVWLIGVEVILMLLGMVELNRQNRSDTPVLLGALVLAITLLIGG